LGSSRPQKDKSLKRPEIERGMRSFIRTYEPKRAIIVSKSLKNTLQIGKTQVNFIPYTNLCLEENKDAY